MTREHLKDIPDLVDHPYEWAWNLHPTNPMNIVIYHWSKPVMSIFLGEALESSSRKEIIKHIIECDNTPWLERWQKEKKDMEYSGVVNILKKDYVNG